MNNTRLIIKYNIIFFQEASLLNIAIEYETIIYNKLTYYILFLDSKVYI